MQLHLDLSDNLLQHVVTFRALYLVSFPYVCVNYPRHRLEPSLLGASVNVKIHTFSFLQLQSRPPVVKYVVPPFCSPSCQLLFSVWKETSLDASKAAWQQLWRIMKWASDTVQAQTASRQMKCNILKVLCNVSFICRYQIVLDDTSITIHKPALWAIRISPVTPLYISQSEMRGIKTQLAFVRWCPLYILAHMFHIFLRSIKHHGLRPFFLVRHNLVFWVKNPLSPDENQILAIHWSIQKSAAQEGLISHALSQIP